MKSNNRILSYLKNNEIDASDRLFLLLVITSMIGLFVATVTGIFIGENAESIIICFVALGVFLTMTIVAYRINRVKELAHIAAFILVVIFLPFQFFTSGGIHGGATQWIIFYTVYITMLIKGKWRVFFLITEAVVIAAVYVLYKLYPSLVVAHTEDTAWLDSFLCTYLVSAIILIMLSFQVGMYRAENKKVTEQKEEIDELNRVQNQFFSSMSHEIRTPINTIIGLNEMILREATSDEIYEDAENIQSASNILLHLINDILDMSKVRAGQMDLSLMAYDTAEMISDVVGMMWIRAREKGLQFSVDISPSLPAELMGDEMRIKQILINILNNAVKYTKEGGITLSINSEERMDREIDLVITVVDTGIGIRKESIPYLFDAFKRLDEGQNIQIEGTGLGLSIVKEFLDLMGGRISVNSVYTKGSTFTITIPQRRVGDRMVGEINMDRRPVGKRKEYKAGFTAEGAKVLVVDDTRTNLIVTKKLLSATGVEVTCVSSGAEALEKTLEEQYHVILMDHLMPEMDGIQCMRKIRNQTGGLSRQTPIVALTANASSESAAFYAKEGFDGYLSKPINSKVLENELIRLLPPDIITSSGEVRETEESFGLWRDTHKTKAQVLISTDSSADIPSELIEKYGVRVMPILIETDEGIFRDGIDISTDGLLRYMDDENRNIRIHPVESDYYEPFFADCLRDARTVIHISVSANLATNSSYYSAVEAAASFEDVIVVDSGHLSGALGMVVMYACRLAANGETAENIIEKINIVKKNLSAGVLVDNLDYAVRSGHFGNSLNTVVKSLLLRPAVCIKKGKFGVLHWHMGFRKTAWAHYIRRCFKKPANIDRSKLLLIHVSLSPEDRQWILDQVKKLVEFDEIYVHEATPAVALYVGRGTFGLMFMRNNK